MDSFGHFRDRSGCLTDKLVSIDASGSEMTEKQLNFCKGVAKLCEAAESPELYRPIIKLWALYEDNQTGTTDDGKGTITGGNLSNMSADEAQNAAAQMTKLAQAKKEQETVDENTQNAENEVAVNLNDAVNNDENKELAGDVNG